MGFSWSGAATGGVEGLLVGGPWGAAAGAALGGFMGGGSDASVNSAYAMNQQNIDLARETMAWEERMSNSAHQRETADLKLAGLNPILSATHGGAVTPPGIMPPQVNPNVNKASDRAAEMNMMTNSAKMVAEAKAATAQANLANQQAKNISLGYFPGTQIPISAAGPWIANKWNSIKGGLGNSGKAIANLIRNVSQGKFQYGFAD